MHRHHAHLFPSIIQIIRHLGGGLADRTHGDDDAIRILRPVIIKEMMFPARNGRKLLHGLFH